VTQNIGRLQVAHLPRLEGRSNYTIARLFRLWLSMFLNFSVIPLRFATLFGIVFGLLGALAAIIVVAEAISSQKPPQGWASLMVAVLVLAGVQLIVVGLIGEYLGRMFLTNNRKPQYLVREVFKRGSDGLEVERPPANTQAAGQPYRVPSPPETER
jgi:undecaprenyl-phosphate 4-deoxy-4-formamido-L-arabinose transferase